MIPRALLRRGSTALALLAVLVATADGCLLPPLKVEGDGATAGLDACAGPVGPTRGGVRVMGATLDDSASYTKVSQYINDVPVHTDLTYGIWIRGTGSVRVFATNYAWTIRLHDVQCTASPDRWTLCGGTFANGTSTTVSIVAQDDFPTPGTIALDDAFIQRSDGRNLLTNPGFEDGATHWLFSGPEGVTNVFEVQMPVREPPMACP